MKRDKYKSQDGKWRDLIDGWNGRYPVKNIKDACFCLLEEIENCVISDIKRYDQGLYYLGEGTGVREYKSPRQHPVDEYNESLVKDALDQYRKSIVL